MNFKCPQEVSCGFCSFVIAVPLAHVWMSFLPRLLETGFLPWDLNVGLNLPADASDLQENIGSFWSALGKLEDASREPVITWLFSLHYTSSNEMRDTWMNLTCLVCSWWGDLACTRGRSSQCEARTECKARPEPSTEVSTLTKPLRLWGIWFSFLLFSSTAIW